MTTWFKFPTDYRTQPRMFKLKRALRDDAEILPMRIWCFAATQDGSGDLSGYRPEELADAIGYRGDANQMVESLKQSGYLDDKLHIVGWRELFALAESRLIIAKKAAKARWNSNPPTATISNPEDTRLERLERGDSHALHDALHDASPSTHTQVDRLSLTPEQRKETCAKFRVKDSTLNELEVTFRQIKSNYGDPQDIDAFHGWLATANAAKKILARRNHHAPVGDGIPEPTDWRAWIDANCPESAYATGGAQRATPWVQLVPDVRRFIADGMAADGARP